MSSALAPSIAPASVPTLREAIQRLVAEIPGNSARIEAALGAAVSEVGQLEASVRGSTAGMRGARVMLERVPFGVVVAVAEALQVALPPAVHRVAEIAAADGLPLIGGWDITTEGPLVKIYLNASDASVTVRRALSERIGRVVPVPDIEAPHVIGLNVLRSGRLEVKAYQQDQDERRIAELAGSHAATESQTQRAARLAERALALGACAGAVLCWERDASGAARPRAFFVATRGGADAAIEQCVADLPGWDGAAVAALLPFAPGPARSIGVALQGPEAWTVYFKPAGGDRPVASLEPLARFRAGDAEVGIFVAPNELVERAFARTGRHALSFRCRHGAPPRRDIEALMAWAARRVQAAEASGQPPARLLADTQHQRPPSPWHVVDD
ncbi:Hypothetical protein A7982_05175 [Minicystis rosea]|nr:Hypothetical protein A7982_05175 [Minicystis rosea]